MLVSLLLRCALQDTHYLSLLCFQPSNFLASPYVQNTVYFSRFCFEHFPQHWHNCFCLSGPQVLCNPQIAPLVLLLVDFALHYFLFVRLCFFFFLFYTFFWKFYFTFFHVCIQSLSSMFPSSLAYSPWNSSFIPMIFIIDAASSMAKLDFFSLFLVCKLLWFICFQK